MEEQFATELIRRRRVGLALTLGVWLLGYSFGRLSGLVEGLREIHAGRASS